MDLHSGFGDVGTCTGNDTFTLNAQRLDEDEEKKSGASERKRAVARAKAPSRVFRAGRIAYASE